MMALLWGWSCVVPLFGIILLDILYSRYWHPLAKYPGPFWASFTNLWRFLTFYGGEHHLVDQRLHEKYGPVVRIGPSNLSFSTLTAYDAIYGFQSTLEKGDWYQPTRDTETRHSALFGIRTNEEQRGQRKKVLGAAFASSKVATYRPVVEKHIELLLSEIDELRSCTHELVVDLADPLHHHAFDTLYETVFGEPPSYNTPQDRSMTTKAIQMANKGLGAGYLPWLGRFLSLKPVAKFLRRPKYKNGKLMGFSAIARQSFTRILGYQEAITKSLQPSILRNFLLVPTTDEKRLPTRVIALESFNSLFAGPGTTAAALTSILFKLAQPEGQVWQDRIRRECSDGQSSPALNAVVKETLRMNPPFPSGIPRNATASTKLNVGDSVNTVIIPRNTMVSCNLYVLGRSKQIWGDDAEIWKPERWIDKTDSQVKELPTKSDFDTIQQSILSPEERFVVFGKGPRSCIGREIALILISDTVSKIIQKYDLQAACSLKGGNYFEMQYSECTVKLVERNI